MEEEVPHEFFKVQTAEQFLFDFQSGKTIQTCRTYQGSYRALNSSDFIFYFKAWKVLGFGKGPGTACKMRICQINLTLCLSAFINLQKQIWIFQRWVSHF